MFHGWESEKKRAGEEKRQFESVAEKNGEKKKKKGEGSRIHACTRVLEGHVFGRNFAP